MGRIPLGKLAPALAGLAILFGAGVCQADDAQELQLARSRFKVGQYEQAHQQLVPLLDPSLPPCDKGVSGSCRLVDPELIESARVLDAASLVALKLGDQADKQIEKVLRENPDFVPRRTLFPEEVIDRFSEVRDKLRDELESIVERKASAAMQKRVAAQQAREAEEKWIAEVARLASQEKHVERRSRWIAMIPLGIGQYQNGDVRLGAVFTASEILLGATSLVSAVVVSNYVKEFESKGCTGNADFVKNCYSTLNNNIAIAVTVNRLSFAALGGVMLAGVLQAQVAFVPEKVTFSTRPIPPRPKAHPTVSIGPGPGLGIGLVGSF